MAKKTDVNRNPATQKGGVISKQNSVNTNSKNFIKKK